MSQRVELCLTLVKSNFSALFIFFSFFLPLESWLPFLRVLRISPVNNYFSSHGERSQSLLDIQVGRFIWSPTLCGFELFYIPTCSWISGKVTWMIIFLSSLLMLHLFSKSTKTHHQIGSLYWSGIGFWCLHQIMSRKA